MPDRDPIVSVIIPTYNRAVLLEKAIKSVLKQTFSNFELIIVDDASSDQTTATIDRLYESCIKYIKHNKNMGVCAARNTGLAQAKGEYVAFLDSDDEWMPDKLQRQIDRFNEANERIGVIYTWLKVVDINAQFQKLRKPSLHGNIEQDLLYSNFIGTPSTPMIKRNYIEKTLGFDTRLRCCEDWDIWLQLAHNCEFDLIPEPLVQYRDHSDKNRGSINHSAVVEGYLHFLQKHHSKLFSEYRSIGSFSLPQKANYLFNIGRRLLCHGSAINHEEAVTLGKKYLRLSLDADPFNPQIYFHYFSSLPGSKFYPRIVHLEASGKKLVSNLLK
ncbi:putative glycosyltransferase [Halomicronema hongdechloris C2206]|uniref:Glycosyltransferase n=1 Tax=Halomicronema hongdechloris C2206 TaxID=1641165 RepID=A0A1Z3HH56_9CYAN|nr:glycosyltransferase [Halomicronema hongdechloris]ASC69626.1 putative glycosyltransferase [Halomicronema hongdechloris C2206]